MFEPSQYIPVDNLKPDGRFKKPRFIVKGIDFRQGGVFLAFEFSAHHSVGGGWLKIDGGQSTQIITDNFLKGGKA